MKQARVVAIAEPEVTVGNKPQPEPQDSSHLRGMIDLAVEWATEDAAVTLEMKQAIQAGRLRDALLCACKLTAIEPTDVIKSLPDPQTGQAAPKTYLWSRDANVIHWCVVREKPD